MGLGPIVASGKTKDIISVKDLEDVVVIRSRDDITAGDGARHKMIVRTADHPGKGELSNIATCRIFEYLKKRGIPTAYIKQLNEASFLAYKCDMVSLELVSRRYTYGSWLKRNPGHEPLERFDKPAHEMYLKTNDRQWQGKRLFGDDPLMTIEDGYALLYDPKMPLDQQLPQYLRDYPLKDSLPLLVECTRIQEAVFLALEEAWIGLGLKFVDLKIEVGITADGRLVLADVIDADSGRLLDKNNEHIDKEPFRKTDNPDTILDLMANKLMRFADLTAQFPKVS